MSTTSTTPALPGVARLVPPKTARDLAVARRRAAGGADRPEATAAASVPGPLTEALEVECDDDGAPYRLSWRDRRHVVVAEPVRWFERRRWWDEESRVERGRGAGVVDHEIWRLQVRLEAAAGAEARTLDLSRHVGSGRWRLLRVHDAAA
ncbi:hypothetical protein GCM10027060_04330 [Nesterenkonia halophila]